MAMCPLADDCPHFSEQIDGMGCQHFGDRGGMEWCKHYNQPIEDLKTAPVVPGEEVIVEVTDMHESGAGVGHHQETGFVIMVDGVLPEAWVEATVDTVKSNYARASLEQKLDGPPGDDGDTEVEGEDTAETAETSDDETEAEDATEERKTRAKDDPRLGSRENFWGS
ncbi:TRAM domain-containing protein [Halodesulfurarchaeum formicicum]|uniref:TRAM domain-containing protein n=1 Tax=Halodesulfurarchaeum formicicum TaxID=1873524 RepID=A0A1J1AA29_9EURY|nr:TRAM domain-containing protein [Halodesulfurarchaeum formicicum]APE94591.1 TRAM domain-containing protein [Halodesulfurarchaeum formicicum]